MTNVLGAIGVQAKVVSEQEKQENRPKLVVSFYTDFLIENSCY